MIRVLIIYSGKILINDNYFIVNRKCWHILMIIVPVIYLY